MEESEAVSKLVFGRWKPPPASVPEGTRIYSIGDIHGRLDLLDEVIARVDVDMGLHPVSNAIRVFLGDYIDRGPDSKRVLDRLINYCMAQPTVCLMGNHEVFLRQFLRDPETLSIWGRCGGLDTLLSYGLAPEIDTDASQQRELASQFDRMLPTSHREFLGGLRPYFICGDFFFVHAGVRPGISLTEQSEDDLFWISRRVSLLPGRFWQSCRTWAHACRGAGRASKSHKHRYGRLRDRKIDVSCARTR